MDFQGAYVKKQSVQELEHIFNIFPSAELEQISRCIDFQGVYAQKQSVQELEHISNVLAKERTYPGAYVQDKFKIILSVRMNIKGRKQASLIPSIN